MSEQGRILFIRRNGMKIKSKISILVLLILFLASLPLSAQAKNISQSPMQRGKPPKILSPDTTSELILDSVTSNTATDGSITIEVNGGHIDGKPEFAYNFNVDLAKNTYKTKFVDVNQVKGLPSQLIKSGENLSPDQGYAPDNVQPLAIVPGTYEARIRVQTRDPVTIPLNQTEDYLKWIVYSNGSVNWVSYTDGCAGYTTILGTHWYTDWCLFASPFINGGLVYNNSGGQYYNWDWHNPNIATYSSHSISLGGNNSGHCTYSWGHSRWGEDYLLIYGVVAYVQCP